MEEKLPQCLLTNQRFLCVVEIKKKILVIKLKYKQLRNYVKIPFYADAHVIFPPEEPHSPESFPCLGHKTFLLSLL